MTRTLRRRRLPTGTPAPANLYDRTGIIGASEAGRRAGDPADPAERGGLRHAALVMSAAAALFFVGWLGTHGVPTVTTPLETAQAPVQAPPRVVAQPEPVVEKPAVQPETPEQQAPKPATAVVAASETTAKKKPEKKPSASTAEARSDLPPQTTQPKPKNPVEQFEEQFQQLVGPVFDQMVSQARGGR